MDEHQGLSVDYGRALAAAAVFLGHQAENLPARDLPAVLADWAAEGEALLRPIPALDPARRNVAVAA